MSEQVRLVDAFIDGLGWVLERKDMDGFWPVGLASTCRQYGPWLAEDIERALARYSADDGQPGSSPSVDFPTSFTVVALCLVYGARELRWGATRAATAIDTLLQIASSEKAGDPLNRQGRNAIWSEGEAAAHLERGQSCSGLVTERTVLRRLNAMSGLLLAYAEALYFCNHRIGTEKHGPYPCPAAGGILLVRSARNLAPRGLWPELGFDGALEGIGEIEIGSVCRPFPVRFDLFSNIIHGHDVNLITEGAYILVKDDGAGATTSLTHGGIERISSVLLEATDRATETVRAMSPARRAEQMIRILYYACRHLLGMSGEDWHTLADRCVAAGRNRVPETAVPGDVGGLLHYYDVRKPIPE